jgi:hypothetical protein
VPAGNLTSGRCWNIAGGVRGRPCPARPAWGQVDSSAGRHTGQKKRSNLPPICSHGGPIQARSGSYNRNLLICIDKNVTLALRVHFDGATRAWDPVVPILGQITCNPAFSCSCQSVASGILRVDRRRPCFVPDARYPRVLEFRPSRLRSGDRI